MAKKSLLSMVSQLPDGRAAKKPTWYERLEVADTAFYTEMLEVIDKHLSGDPAIRKKLPTETTLVNWLQPIIAEHGESLSTNTIYYLVRHRKKLLDGKVK